MVQQKVRHIKTRISPDFLDTIGRSFKFKHGKGVAEWLKNSLDQYLRLREKKEESLQGAWPVFVHLIDGTGQTKGPNLAVIDFGGTSHKEIEEFFLHWGDTSAASHGGKINRNTLTGGHGNGGKFYMREMWRDGARFLTWKKGKVTSLVVRKMDDKSTGYFELEDETMSWRDAMGFALSNEESLGGSDALVETLLQKHPQIYAELENKARGFSVIVGRRAVQTTSANDIVHGGRWKHQQLIDEIVEAQQARRPIRELAVSVFVNGQLQIDKLVPQSIEEDPSWGIDFCELLSSDLKDFVDLSDKDVLGSLSIFKSINQLTGRLKDLNTLFITDENGNPIAFYPIYELPLPGYSPLVSFIHAELQLGFSGISEFVTNDRERLVGSSTTKSLLEWVADKIWKRIQLIEKAYQENKHKKDLEMASKLNESLNKHAQRFLKQVQSEIMVDFVKDAQGGGAGSSGTGSGGTEQGNDGTNERENGRGGSKGKGGDIETPGDTKRVRRSEFPKMLLSSFDLDPAQDYQEKRYLTDRHPPLFQEDIDRKYNVWWLNTSHPFAEKALKRGGAEGHAFKSHQLSMFRDMVQREALRMLQRRESELPLDRIENELDERSNQFLAELPYSLVETLLD